jgi:catechol 2,3-dioxygenase-like lactoylglutathione lyase family enzyme
MINHVSIGVHDITRAKRFYDAVFEPLGYRCLSSSDTSLGYGKDAVVWWIGTTQSPVSSNPDNGLHFCFNASTRAAVTQFHKAATNNGGQDNGKPGLRVDYGDNYFAAFVVDPDGYRLEAYCANSD